eukprot:TRINITY_DN12235_c0_g1_i2.p1 TRINITY_DN12235_c0_g1~~TRINITY_DN12235_c0_g1_i2.p1  ORF type:complete len:110 (-),score=10.39 TRINITY_DN12235_c0_g1_i2:76-405(-)
MDRSSYVRLLALQQWHCQHIRGLGDNDQFVHPERMLAAVADVNLDVGWFVSIELAQLVIHAEGVIRKLMKLIHTIAVARSLVSMVAQHIIVNACLLLAKRVMGQNCHLE